MQLELDRVVGADRDVGVLICDSTGDAEGGNGGVEEGGCDFDGDVDVNALGRGGLQPANFIISLDFARRVALYEIAGDDEVVGMPLKGCARQLG